MFIQNVPVSRACSALVSTVPIGPESTAPSTAPACVVSTASLVCSPCVLHVMSTGQFTCSIHTYCPTRVSVITTGSVCLFVFLYFFVFSTSHALDNGINILFFNSTMVFLVFPVFFLMFCTSCYAGCSNSLSRVSVRLFTSTFKLLFIRIILVFVHHFSSW